MRIVVMGCIGSVPKEVALPPDAIIGPIHNDPILVKECLKHKKLLIPYFDGDELAHPLNISLVGSDPLALHRTALKTFVLKQGDKILVAFRSASNKQFDIYRKEPVYPRQPAMIVHGIKVYKYGVVPLKEGRVKPESPYRMQRINETKPSLVIDMFSELKTIQTNAIQHVDELASWHVDKQGVCNIALGEMVNDPVLIVVLVYIGSIVARPSYIDITQGNSTFGFASGGLAAAAIGGF